MVKTFKCTCGKHKYKVFDSNEKIRVVSLSPAHILKNKMGLGQTICDGSYGDFVRGALRWSSDLVLNGFYRRKLRLEVPYLGDGIKEWSNRHFSPGDSDLNEPNVYLFRDGVYFFEELMVFLGVQFRSDLYMHSVARQYAYSATHFSVRFGPPEILDYLREWTDTNVPEGPLREAAVNWVHFSAFRFDFLPQVKSFCECHAKRFVENFHYTEEVPLW